ncbi:MAG TPA: PAS domain-containing protein, partial [Rubrivivax sp.]|nr:PAS domain-containing protein [Rubrivivax sp.]
RHYLLVNDAWCRINGIARESILGRRAYEVAPQWVSPQRQQAVRLALEQGQTSVVRDTRSTGQGLVRHLESTYYPYGDERGRFVVIVTRDTSAQHLTMDALRASEAAQRALLAAFPGYIAVVGADGRYRFVNDRFAARLGRDASGIVGEDIPSVLGTARGRKVLENIEQALREGIALSVVHYPAAADLGAMSLEVTHVAAPGRRARSTPSASTSPNGWRRWRRPRRPTAPSPSFWPTCRTSCARRSTPCWGSASCWRWTR